METKTNDPAINPHAGEPEIDDTSAKGLVEKALGSGAWDALRGMDKGKRKELVKRIRSVAKIDEKIVALQEARKILQVVIDQFKAKVEIIRKTFNE